MKDPEYRGFVTAHLRSVRRPDPAVELWEGETKDLGTVVSKAPNE